MMTFKVIMINVLLLITLGFAVYNVFDIIKVIKNRKLYDELEDKIYRDEDTLALTHVEELLDFLNLPNDEFKAKVELFKQSYI